MLIDSHTHLNTDQLFDKWETYMENFENEGGKILVNAGANDQYNQKGIEIAKESKNKFKNLIIKTAIGIHPCDISNNESDILSEIQNLKNLYNANQPFIVAIGECGIDLHSPENPDFSLQQYALKLQANLARELGLPLMIHSRDAFNETIEILKDFSDLKIYFHARGYGSDELKKAESLFPNLWIGCTNVICYPSANNIREAIKNKKTAKLLTETDAPFLPPQCFRGQQNEPAYVSYVYDKLGEILNLGKSNLENIIMDNTKNLYGI